MFWQEEAYRKGAPYLEVPKLMMGFAEIELESDRPEVLFKALAPELEDEINRSAVSMETGESFLRLRIEGSDLVSIRAALNTWIRLLNIAMEMVRI